MNVFLTGGTGFIGSHVARVLVRDGHTVLALVRPDADLRRLTEVSDRIRLVQGELGQPEALAEPLREFRPEVCLHLAWYAVPGKYLEAPENVDCVNGSLRLLQVLHQAGCPRTVTAGTCFEYDWDAGYLGEESPIKPRSLYAASKYGLFLMAEKLQRNLGRSFAHARIFYQYGPWEDERRLVPVVLKKLLAGEPLQFSSGSPVRDYLHIEDVATALAAIAGSSLEGPVNIGSGQPYTVRQIVEMIQELAGRPDQVRFGAVPDRPGDPPFICANAERLRTGTGWAPRFTLREGLTDTLAWFQARWSGSAG